MTGGMIATTTGVMVVVTRTTTTATTTTARSLLHHHPQKGQPGAFQTANRQINFIIGGRQAAKSNRR
jgi:hypothetical protein